MTTIGETKGMGDNCFDLLNDYLIAEVVSRLANPVCLRWTCRRMMRLIPPPVRDTQRIIAFAKRGEKLIAGYKEIPDRPDVEMLMSYTIRSRLEAAMRGIVSDIRSYKRSIEGANRFIEERMVKSPTATVGITELKRAASAWACTEHYPQLETVEYLILILSIRGHRALPTAGATKRVPFEGIGLVRSPSGK